MKITADNCRELAQQNKLTWDDIVKWAHMFNSETWEAVLKNNKFTDEQLVFIEGFAGTLFVRKVTGL